MTKLQGTIFNIQRFSIHDGPGIRTTVFFKGCNLKCKWCHNPESIAFHKQLEFYPDRCVKCGACIGICPNFAHEINENMEQHINREKCTGCLLCVETCYGGALVAVGQQVTSEYLIETIMTDELYFKNSSGGVTFSGGECMLQIKFLEDILNKCKERGIQTAVDTAGNVPWSSFEAIIPYTDLFLYDVKAACSEIHRSLTGVNNELILENLKKLSELGKDIYVRIPYIPGYNGAEIDKIGEILKPLNIKKVEVLPYHKLGGGKYLALDIDREMLDIEAPEEELLEDAVKLLRSKGINAEKS